MHPQWPSCCIFISMTLLPLHCILYDLRYICNRVQTMPLESWNSMLFYVLIDFFSISFRKHQLLFHLPKTFVSFLSTNLYVFFINPRPISMTLDKLALELLLRHWHDVIKLEIPSDNPFWRDPLMHHIPWPQMWIQVVKHKRRILEKILNREAKVMQKVTYLSCCFYRILKKNCRLNPHKLICIILWESMVDEYTKN